MWNFSNDWIRTANLWCRKRPLCQWATTTANLQEFYDLFEPLNIFTSRKICLLCRFYNTKSLTVLRIKDISGRRAKHCLDKSMLMFQKFTRFALPWKNLREWKPHVRPSSGLHQWCEEQPEINEQTFTWYCCPNFSFEWPMAESTKSAFITALNYASKYWHNLRHHGKGKQICTILVVHWCKFTKYFDSLVPKIMV